MDIHHPSGRPSLHQDASHQKWAKKKVVIPAAIIALLIMLGLLGALLFTLRASNESSSVQKDNYQAVFLSNGQVYFGNIKHIDATYVAIENIFYLQQQSQEPQDQQSSQEAQQDVSDTALTKLGDELHGPQDVMYINRDQLLFWENLKSDGKVSEAIKAYSKN